MVALNELSRALATALSVPHVLEEVYRGVSRLLDTTNFYIALHDPERHEVSFAINATESVLDREITVLPADQGITGYIIRTHESVLIKSDVNGWLAERGMPHVGEPAQSWLGVPLMMGDQVQGVMAVQSYTTPNAYDEHDRDLLVAIASQAAITLQNARSFEQAQARARREQTLREVTARLRGSTDPDAVMRALARELGTVLGRPTFVRLVTPEGGKAEELTPAPATQMTDGQVAAS
jgi:GAF domain-containing protein